MNIRVHGTFQNFFQIPKLLIAFIFGIYYKSFGVAVLRAFDEVKIVCVIHFDHWIWDGIFKGSDELLIRLVISAGFLPKCDNIILISAIV